MKNKIIFFLLLILFNVYLFNSFRSDVRSQDVIEEPTPTIETQTEIPTDVPTSIPTDITTEAPTPSPTDTPIPTPTTLSPSSTPTSTSTPAATRTPTPPQSPTPSKSTGTNSNQNQQNTNSNNNQSSSSNLSSSTPTPRLSMSPNPTTFIMPTVKKVSTEETILGVADDLLKPTQTGKLLNFQSKSFPFFTIFLTCFLGILAIRIIIVLTKQLLPSTQKFRPYCYKKAKYFLPAF